ncbi:MAG TPA: orotidine-5'-phosphate decarboxylase [Elusimicrobia bacterium]|nr:MAG: orotidine 5'-phosphate decarboxylase [Elusimicrobia bacterium RIFOXYD2_FULL_34_30]HAM38730.1 orotidine-5'-phosphate decarboxylase [Elusimicrobiota bacterium]
MELIVALDVDNISQAEILIDLLKDKIKIFKVGSRLFTSEGPEIIDLINKKGCKVFLDLKYYDIPTVIADAVKIAGEKGVFSTTLHISGGRNMLKLSVQQKPRPLIWGVTVLTSFDENNLREIGVMRKIDEQVENLARLASEVGLDGIVCSAKEISIVKKVSGLKIIVPGIRLNKTNDDQKRTLTPREAKELGADYIVVGRPIIKSENPLIVVDTIRKEII